jgi:hypothetical protein
VNGINETATVELITGTTSSAMKSTGSTFSINGADSEQTWKVTMPFILNLKKISV